MIEQKHLTTKEFVLITIIGVSIWWVPKWILNIQQEILSGILPAIGFFIGYWVVMFLRKFRKNKLVKRRELA